MELNLDGLVGPTHHYAGLATGNLASTTHALMLSNPQAAALQGLKKMRLLHQLGVKQAVLPPHQRPNLKLLARLGFKGRPVQQIEKAFKEAPSLLSNCYSAASMWTANAATVSASIDTADAKVHFTAANLATLLHRSQESNFSSHLLKKIFSNPRYFHHHQPLPFSATLGDEGAANYNRLCVNHQKAALSIFVYGKKLYDTADYLPQKYLARQSLEASQAIARQHQLNSNKLFFVRQTPEAIDAGVFHNDVIAVANEALLFLHEKAFVEQQDFLKQLQTTADFELKIIELKEEQISLETVVNSYLFNSQLITLPESGKMNLIAPAECEQNKPVKLLLDALIRDNSNPIDAVHYLDLKQSMQNGGGPACLRLRAPLTEIELGAMHQGILITNSLLDSLETWVLKHYRTSLQIQDLGDSLLLNETFTALDELSALLKLGSIYPFQQD